MVRSTEPDSIRIDQWLDPGFDVDAQLTLGPLRHGLADPTIRFEPGGVVWRAMRTDAGAATIRLAPSGVRWRVTAWGDGAAEALATLPRLLGADDEPSRLVLPDGPLRELARRL